MASNTNDKKPCSKCGCKGWIFLCDGCQTSFCVKHANEHRQELEIQLNNIQKESNLLQQHIYNQNEKCQKHPLFSQINIWQHNSIEKIIQTTQIAHNELQKLLDESNNKTKIIFNQFNNQLQTEHYTEIELHQWKEQLINIRKQLETSYDIELISDKNQTPIHLIKINSTKQNSLVFQPIQSSQSSMVSECTSILEQNESNPVLSPNTLNILLDPIENNHFIILLQLSSTNQSQLFSILNQLTDYNFEIFYNEKHCLDNLQHGKQTTIFIDLFNIALNSQNDFLDKISEFENVYSIYIRGNPSDDDNERADFFRRYSKIKAIFENEQRLIVQWIIDTANELKKTGDMYVKIGDKYKGRHCFEQGITLYKRLSKFLNEKRRIR